MGQLPSDNQRMAALLVRHLHKVSTLASSNLMTVSNLGVCFGPTLLRPEEETMAAIMDIKFCNVVVEILIENCDKIFKAFPEQEEAKVTAAMARPPEVASAASSSDVLSRDKPKKGPHLFPPVASAEGGPGYTSPFAEPHSYGVSRPYSSQQAEAKRFGPAGPKALRGTQLPPSAHPSHPVAVYNPSWSSGPATGYGARDNSHNVNSNSSSTESLSSRSNASFSHHSPVPATREYHSSPRVPDASKSSQSSVAAHHYGGRKVRTLYACVGENNSELSFEPNQIIENVRPSRERGWLEGWLNGRVGLVPENYVEFLP